MNDLVEHFDDPRPIVSVAAHVAINCVDYYVLPTQHADGDMWGVKARSAA